MGILDIVLRPHLEAITKYFKTNELQLLSKYESDKIQESDSEKNAKIMRLRLDNDSEKFRQQGNQFFKARDFNQALFMYTKSVATAIEGPLASLAYFNRSAALFQMKLFEDCIIDIDRALECGYPKKQQLYSLYLRKAKCLKFLKKHFTDCLAEVMTAIEENCTNDETKRLSELVLSKMEEPMPDFKEKLPKANIWKLPELSYGKNPEVPSFSSAINLVHSKELGRHVLANRNINTGDVLSVEESIVFSINNEVNWNFCNFCLKHCYTLIPCKECAYSMYCSKNCRNSDWSSAHKAECNKIPTPPTPPLPLRPFKLEEFTGPSAPGSGIYSIISITIRLIAHIGLDNIKNAVLQNKPMPSLLGDPRTKGFQDGKFEAASLEALLSLEDNFDTLTSAEENLACKRVLWICGVLNIPLEEWLTIGAVFIKLYLVQYYNCLAMDCYRTDINAETTIQPRMQLGRGLFLASSLVNHSCNANVYQVMYGTSSVFRARRPIKEGEQITFCYSIPATFSSYEERQMTLWNEYKFICRCTACVGSATLLKYLEPSPEKKKLKRWLQAGGINQTKFCNPELPVTKQMLPKLLVLLQHCHASGQKSNQLYFNLQKTIQNHYMTEGNCFFFGDSKEILSGELVKMKL